MTTDGSSPSLPAPPADTLFSLPRLSCPPLSPSPPHGQLCQQRRHPRHPPGRSPTQKRGRPALLRFPPNPLNPPVCIYTIRLSWPRSFQFITAAEGSGAAGQSQPGLSECGCRAGWPPVCFFFFFGWTVRIKKRHFVYRRSFEADARLSSFSDCLLVYTVSYGV